MSSVSKRGNYWVADFYDGKGKRQRIYRHSKAEAESELHNSKVAVEAGTYEPLARTTTLATLAEKYLKAKAVRWRPGTRDLNKGLVNNHILSAEYGLGRRKVKDITLDDCDSFRRSLRKARPDLKPRTVNMVMTQLGALLKYGQRNRLRVDNPCSFVERLEEPRREVEILSPEQVQRLLQAMPSERDKVLTQLALLTGARWGELTALCWRDVDEERKRLAITATNSHDETRKAFVAEGKWPAGPKTPGSNREALLSTGAVQLLRRWRLASGRPQASALIFANEEGHPIDGNAWRSRVWLSARKAAQLPAGCTFHTLRHNYASQMLTQGVQAEWVSRNLGHSSVLVTLRRYRRWVQDSDSQWAEAIDRAWTAGSAS